MKKENRSKIRFLFDGKNTRVSVRDEKSREILRGIGIGSELLDDPVFLYDINKSSSIKASKLV